ncbi:MAG: hypothetical protein AB8B53_08585 [Flavobacteriales bacterium]
MAESLANSASLTSLHFRDLALQREEALLIAAVFKDMRVQDNEQLRSVSFSYNDQLTDEGAVALVDSFPSSVTELGMVGCRLTDEAGVAILNWLKRSPNIQMVCIEGNDFSVELRLKMHSHQGEHPNRTLIF